MATRTYEESDELPRKEVSGADFDLLMAISSNSVEDAQEALRQGADPNLFVSASMLSQAIANGNAEMVQLLLDHGAKPNLKTEEARAAGETPLVDALELDDPQCAELLLNKKADARVIRQPGNISALHMAVENHPQLTDRVIKAGADVNAQTDMSVGGETALMIAAKRGDTETMRKLLDAGAYVTFKNADGKTVSDIMEENKAAYDEESFTKLQAEIAQRGKSEKLPEKGPTKWQRFALPIFGGWSDKKLALYDSAKRLEAFRSGDIFDPESRKQLLASGLTEQELQKVSEAVHNRENGKGCSKTLAANCGRVITHGDMARAGLNKRQQKALADTLNSRRA